MAAATLRTAFDSVGSRVLRTAERRLPALTRMKQPEPLPIVLHRRRIYVLPTRFGVGFGALLAVMTLGALNYNNNPALMLCFLLASVAHTSLLQGFLGLRGLRLQDVSAEPVHAGDTLRVKLRFDAERSLRRRGLLLQRGDVRRTFALESAGGVETELALHAPQRGWLRLGRMSLSLRRPLGLFVAWSWVNPDVRLLVYPALEAHAPPLPGYGADGAPQRRRGPDEQVHGIRDYRTGDPLRAIAWKRSAQLGRLSVREYESPQRRDALLDWSQLTMLDPEARIRRLARWVVEAERIGVRSELRLPGVQIGPGRGPLHVHACLRTLALHGQAD